MGSEIGITGSCVKRETYENRGQDSMNKITNNIRESIGRTLDDIVAGA